MADEKRDDSIAMSDGGASRSPDARQQSGGVSISGRVGNVGGNIVGGSLVGGGNVGAVALEQVDGAFAPVAAAVAAAPPETRAAAEAKLGELKAEAAKGDNADDGVLARLVRGLVELVPAAATGIGTVFAGPVLGGLVGPVTKFLLDGLKRD